jgi:hypothetical protein
MRTISAHELKVGDLLRWRDKDREFTRKVYDIEVDKRFSRSGEGGTRPIYRVVFERDSKLPHDLPTRAEYPAGTPIVTLSEHEAAALDLAQEGSAFLDGAARLARIALIIECVEARCMAVDGPVPRTLEVMHEAELMDIYQIASGKKAP